MYILLAVSIFLGVFKSAIYNQYAKSEKPNAKSIFRFNAVSYGTAAIVTLLFGIGKSLSAETLICAAAYAAVVFSLQALSVAAMISGPMSLTSLFVLYGMIIPSLAGPIFWKEAFGIGQVLGMIIMLVSLKMLYEPGEGDIPANRKWSVMAAMCFLLSGAAGVIEKVHQTSYAKDERLMFLFCACVMMFLLSAVGNFVLNEKAETAVSKKAWLILGTASGLVVSLYSQTNLTLAGKLDSLIYYPVANGGALLLTVLFAVLIFHEKLSKRRLAGFVAGILAVVLLSIPIG